MQSPRRTIVPAALVALVALTIPACSSGSQEVATATPQSAATATPGAASAKTALEQQRMVIDVRAPDEFAGGHVTGAANLNVQGTDFASQITKLDRSGKYVVYCRSGNRAAMATSQMRAIGLDVLDGGSLADMTAAGWPTTR